MTTNGFQIVHAIPGRLRIKIGKVQGDYALAREIEDRLATIAVIRQATVNPLTGSVLITYDPRLWLTLSFQQDWDTPLVDSLHELLTLAELLDLKPSEGMKRVLEGWFWSCVNGDGATLPSALLEGVRRFLAS